MDAVTTSPHRKFKLTLRNKNNHTIRGTFILYPAVRETSDDAVPADDFPGDNQTVPRTGSVHMRTDTDPWGASSFVVAVVLVYGLSIVFLIASHVFVKNRETDGHDQDRQINTFLQKAPQLKEKSFRESYRKLKTSMLPVIAATSAVDLISRRKSFAPYLIHAQNQLLEAAAALPDNSESSPESVSPQERDAIGQQWPDFTCLPSASGGMPTIHEDTNSDDIFVPDTRCSVLDVRYDPDEVYALPCTPPVHSPDSNTPTPCTSPSADSWSEGGQSPASTTSTVECSPRRRLSGLPLVRQGSPATTTEGQQLLLLHTFYKTALQRRQDRVQAGSVAVHGRKTSSGTPGPSKLFTEGGRPALLALTPANGDLQNEAERDDLLQITCL